MGKATFIILHYKDQKATELCVRSILRMEAQEKPRIVIVDNDSGEPEEVRERLRKLYQSDSNITVLPIREACGFSRANNIGYRYAKAHFQQDYLILCNNDIEFTQRSFLQRVDEIYRETGFAVLGPDVIRRGTGEHQNPMDTALRSQRQALYTIRMNRAALRCFHLAYPLLCLQGRLQKKRKQKEQRQREAFYQTRQEQIIPCGACLILSRAYFAGQREAFSPETSFFYEEYILAYQCRRRGEKILYDPSLTVLHESGASTKKEYRQAKSRMRFQLEQTANACEIYRQLIGRRPLS